MRRVATSCASRRSVPGNTNRNSRDLDPMSRRSDPILALFFVSGFAGLIYESVWSHYVKLFLGHAAYAQTLVLVVFMGGLAFGAWLCARVAGRGGQSPRLFLIVARAVGLPGVALPPIFLWLGGWGLSSLVPPPPEPGAPLFAPQPPAS